MVLGCVLCFYLAIEDRFAQLPQTTIDNYSGYQERKTARELQFELIVLKCGIRRAFIVHEYILLLWSSEINGILTYQFDCCSFGI